MNEKEKEKHTDRLISDSDEVDKGTFTSETADITSSIIHMVYARFILNIAVPRNNHYTYN